MIKELSLGEWLHVPTEENPADQGTRANKPERLTKLWLKGPKWLKEGPTPKQPEILETEESNKERSKSKAEKVMMAQQTHTEDGFAEMMTAKYPFWKLMRITAYILRFKDNVGGGPKTRGPLVTEELNRAEQQWIKLIQRISPERPKDVETSEEEGTIMVKTRVPGYKPILLPQRGEFTRRVIEYYHIKTLHGGVASTMSKIREKFWIPKLRSLVKTLVHRCNLCKRGRVKRLHHAATSDLPTFRTEYSRPWAVIGVDHAGPLEYKELETTQEPPRRGKKTWIISKLYIVLFTCTLSRAVHLGLCKSLTAQEFQFQLKEFITRRDRPDMIVSDNAKTFQATAKWINTLEKDDDLQNYLSQNNIKWKFNLARAPWWGGFYERLIGIMKRSLSKQVGKALLTYDELKDVLMDTENFMNNRPLTYMGEEAEQQVLTPNTLLKGSTTQYPTEDLEKINYLEEDKLVTKRLAYLQKTRQLLKKRYLNEYVHALRDQRNKVRPQEIPAPGSVVLVTDHLSGNGFKPTWTLAKVLTHVKGKDGVVRGLELKSTSGYTIQRPLELCRNLEIVKQSVEESSVAQPGTQCAEPTTLDDVATTCGDDFNQDDEEKSRYTRAKHYRDDFTSTENGNKQGKRQAAKNASEANRLLLRDELHTLI